MSSEPPRVLIVDDSQLLRRIVRDVLESEGFSIVGEAADGWSAIEQARHLEPDLVTLDIMMPGINGLETLDILMSEKRRPVVMLSSADEQNGADLTIRALELGAVDFVRKPAVGRGVSVDEPTLRARLGTAAKAAVRGNVMAAARTGPRQRNARERKAAAGPPVQARAVVVVGASTGGPRVLSEVVPALALLPEVAIVVVQHMPAGFTSSLARRLGELSGVAVSEAANGSELTGGSILVAPGGYHVRIVREAGAARTHVDASAPVLGVRPSLDITLADAAELFGADCGAVVLTGMGRDGANGCAAVRRSGGFVLVQSPSSCVVPGMPQAVLAGCGADESLDPQEIASAVMRHVDRRLRR
ncbi:MAG: chemotaxis-specific protein-glutamate methyltransferase CheB [Gemmatimonadota bacterium]